METALKFFRPRSLVIQWRFFVLSCLLAAGCTQGTLHPVSDVPCLEEPSAWPADLGTFYVRGAAANDGDLLFVHYSIEQLDVDWADDIYGNAPHGAVYRFSSDTPGFQQVDDTAWDESDQAVTFCGAQYARDVGFGIGRGFLTFEGRQISVAGRTIIQIWGAPNSPVVAVLTTDGSYVSVPSLTAPIISGQYYHQLFSEVDGSQIGQSVRVGVGGRTPNIDICWTEDESYVIYSDYTVPDELNFAAICVVDVRDQMTTFRGE